MRPLDLSLYLVTDTVLCGGSTGVADTVARAVPAGVTAVQVRDPLADDETFVALGRAVADRMRGKGIPLLVNDRVHLAGGIGADGAHVGQSDLDPVAARAMLLRDVGPGALLGLSVQTIRQVREALALPEGTIDYLGVGPVFAQSTKPDAGAPSGLAALAEIVALSPWPCVAIGGIDAARTPAARATGAAGVAVVSAICGQADVAAATRALRAAWDDSGHDTGERAREAWVGPVDP